MDQLTAANYLIQAI